MDHVDTTACPPRPRNSRRRVWVRRGALCCVVLASVPVLAWLGFLAAVAWSPYPAGLDRTPTPATLVRDRHGVPLAAFAAPDGQWRFPLGDGELSPHLLDAIVAVEDARFFDHDGVDWRAACAAVWQNATALRVRRGASTLTMQLQRLRDPQPRSLAGKVMQAVRARQIERGLGKREILVEYLNRAPFGGNLIGAGAASWRYFGKPCAGLSLAEAALLAGLPKNPNRYRPDRFAERATRRRNLVLDRMLACGMIGREAHAHAVAEPVRVDWLALPQARDAGGAPADGALPTLIRLPPPHREISGVAVGTVTASVDAGVQRQAADAAHALLRRVAPSGVSAAAVVVLDTQTAECLAAVSLSPAGSAGVDLTRRPRSTGSVLKPLIYAAAFEAGVCTPATVLDDSPSAWPGYAPEDFDHQFRGQMTAADALAESRNIPAMVVLARTGVEHVRGVMQAAGLETLGRAGRAYGLSLAVGGAEATPMEVATAYAGLGRGGVAARPVLTAETRGGLVTSVGGRKERHSGEITASASHASRRPFPASTGTTEDGRFLSRGACVQALLALAERDRTAALSREAARLNVAWKTGTSSGNRDAWCAAVTPGLTVVVWLGNAGGEPSAALVGRDAAAPLALELMAALEPTPAEWTPDGVQPPVGNSLATGAAPNARQRLGIVSPAPGREIILSADVPAARQRVAMQSAGAEAGTVVHWFIDGEHLAASPAGASVWWSPVPGAHEVRAVDSRGRAATCRIMVTGRVPAVARAGQPPRGPVGN